VLQKPVSKFRLESRPAPPVFQPNRGSAQLKSAISFRLETRTAPPVYRPQARATQPKQSNSHRPESRPAPPVYRPNAAVQQESQAGLGVEKRPAPAVYRPGIAGGSQVARRADQKNGKAIQPKFVPDEAFNSSSDRKKAFALLNAAIDAMPGSNVAKLRSSELVVVNFTAGKMTTSRAHSSIDVPHPDESRQGTFTPLAMVAQYHDLKGRTEMDITLDASAESGRSYYLQARTFAHELAAHIAPYVDILEKIKRGEGMSKEDRDFVLAGGSSGGRGEHAGIVGGANQDYDELVRQMALKLSPVDALEMAEDYLLDISRYDPESGSVLKEEKREQFIRQFNEAKSKIDWVKELYSDSAAVQALIARREKKGVLTINNIAIFIVMAAIVVFVLQRMLS
jgi:hypothetical protein